MTDETEAIEEVLEEPKPKRGPGRPRKVKPGTPEAPAEVTSQSWSFAFIGDPLDDNDGPNELTVHHVLCKKGETVEVTDKWLAEKLLANRHFEAR
ncbi:MAG: hypothetical protein ACR2QH_10500 [Geminicoccaceae bacterium]